MNNVVYIGNSIHAVEALSEIKEINLIGVIYQKGKASDNIIQLSLCQSTAIASKKELVDTLKQYDGRIDYAVMYDFGIILPAEITSITEIYNFHPGDLRNNRGSSPINWSILLNHRETKMTLHRVSEEIDLGEVISERSCRIYGCDVPSTLKARLNGEIPSMLMDLIAFREGNKESIYVRDGIYRPRITEKDYSICKDDSLATIDAKIRSQYDCRGAVVLKDGCRKYVRSLREYRMLVD